MSEDLHFTKRQCLRIDNDGGHQRCEYTVQDAQRFQILRMKLWEEHGHGKPNGFDDVMSNVFSNGSENELDEIVDGKGNSSASMDLRKSVIEFQHLLELTSTTHSGENNKMSIELIADPNQQVKFPAIQLLDLHRSNFCSATEILSRGIEVARRLINERKDFTKTLTQLRNGWRLSLARKVQGISSIGVDCSYVSAGDDQDVDTKSEAVITIGKSGPILSSDHNKLNCVTLCFTLSSSSDSSVRMSMSEDAWNLTRLTDVGSSDISPCSVGKRDDVNNQLKKFQHGIFCTQLFKKLKTHAELSRDRWAVAPPGPIRSTTRTGSGSSSVFNSTITHASHFLHNERILSSIDIVDLRKNGFCVKLTDSIFLECSLVQMRDDDDIETSEHPQHPINRTEGDPGQTDTRTEISNASRIVGEKNAGSSADMPHLWLKKALQSALLRTQSHFIEELTSSLRNRRADHGMAPPPPLVHRIDAALRASPRNVGDVKTAYTGVKDRGGATVLMELMSSIRFEWTKHRFERLLVAFVHIFSPHVISPAVVAAVAAETGNEFSVVALRSAVKGGNHTLSLEINLSELPTTETETETDHAALRSATAAGVARSSAIVSVYPLSSSRAVQARLCLPGGLAVEVRCEDGDTACRVTSQLLSRSQRANEARDNPLFPQLYHPMSVSVPSPLGLRRLLLQVVLGAIVRSAILEPLSGFPALSYQQSSACTFRIHRHKYLTAPLAAMDAVKTQSTFNESTASPLVATLTAKLGIFRRALECKRMSGEDVRGERSGSGISYVINDPLDFSSLIAAGDSLGDSNFGAAGIEKSHAAWETTSAIGLILTFECTSVSHAVTLEHSLRQFAVSRPKIVDASAQNIEPPAGGDSEVVDTGSHNYGSTIPEPTLASSASFIASTDSDESLMRRMHLSDSKFLFIPLHRSEGEERAKPDIQVVAGNIEMLHFMEEGEIAIVPIERIPTSLLQL